MPPPRGRAVQYMYFLDANHADDHITMRSHTWIIIYGNRDPIVWNSRRKNTVKTSTFGLYLIDLKKDADLIKSMRYNLRVIDFPLYG